MAFRLVRLDVAGFRGINRPFSLQPAPGLTVILGRNGAGKSSLVQAVAWALFGALAESAQPEFRREDAIVNAFSAQSRAQVHLTLNDGPEMLVVERVRRLGRSTTARSDLTLRQGEQVWGDALAQAELERRLGLGVAEFHSAVLLRQDASRALASGSQDERAATIDRLLGIAQLGELADNLALPVVSREVNRLAREVEAQRAGSLATTMDLRRLLSQREQTLLSRRLSPAQLSRRSLQESLDRAVVDLTNACAMLGVSAPVVGAGAEETLSALRRAITDVRSRRDAALREAHDARERIAVALARLEALDDPPSESEDAPESGNPGDFQTDIAQAGALAARLEQRRDALQKALETAARRQAALASVDARRRGLTERDGDEERLDRELTAIQEQLTILTAAGRRQRAQAQLLNDALEALDASSLDRCPVCNQRVDQTALTRRLRAAVAANQEARLLEDLRAQYRRADEQRRRLLEAQAALRAVEAERSAAAAAVAAAEEAVVTAARASDAGAGADALAELDRQLSQARSHHAHLQERARRSHDAARRTAVHIAATRTLAEATASVASPETLLFRARERQEELDAKIRALEALGPHLASLDAALQDATSVHDYLELKANLERLEGGQPEADQQLQALVSKHARLTALQSALLAIQAAATAYREEALQRALDSVLPDANRYFERLGGHPDYAALTLQPEGRRGANVYWLLAHDAALEHTTYLPTRFSHTQIQVAALAMFFALAARLPSALDLVLLDDPAQSMDRDRQRALAGVLADEARQGQIIVTTENERFADDLQQVAAGALQIVNLDGHE